MKVHEQRLIHTWPPSAPSECNDKQRGGCGLGWRALSTCVLCSCECLMSAVAACGNLLDVDSVELTRPCRKKVQEPRVAFPLARASLSCAPLPCLHGSLEALHCLALIIACGKGGKTVIPGAFDVHERSVRRRGNGPS